DRELYAWANTENERPGSARAELSKISPLMKRLDEVRGDVHRLPVSEALERILSAFPVLESATLLAGEQGRNNVLKIRSMAVERD
ncbi:MAG: hypothetical protein ACE5IM_03050, partial [Nitrospinota bacterium]